MHGTMNVKFREYRREITISLEDSVPHPVRKFFAFYDTRRLISIHSTIRSQINPFHFFSCNSANIDVKLGSFLNS
jgi:hypothetical protein